jgi:hypothetical protein
VKVTKLLKERRVGRQWKGRSLDDRTLDSRVIRRVAAAATESDREYLSPRDKHDVEFDLGIAL